ncbi:MAG: type II toxin-antitoxin system VapC family toxin [Chloroflexia bacterium]|nr:type II toxin-antitoxin system VapC family toxin [Chloroflexia bacterium]
MSTDGLFLLDTTVLVDVSRGREPAFSWLRESLRRQQQLCISAVSVAELFAGLSPRRREEWREFINDLTHWDVTTEIGILAGILRYDLARRGRTIHIPDALIAATALVYGAALVTDNVKDFPMPEIKTVRLLP